MQVLPPTILAQVDWIGSALGVAVSIVVSFVAITLTASYYRFQNIVKQAEEKDPEEMGASASEILRVQLARYVAGCARRGTSFSMSLIKTGTPNVEVRMGSPFVDSVRHAVRRDDVVCVYDKETAALFTESEPEDAVTMLTRVCKSVAAACNEVRMEAMRVGISSYPGHGLSGKDLINVALEGLQETSAECPILLPEIIDIEDEEEFESDETEDHVDVPDEELHEEDELLVAEELQEEEELEEELHDEEEVTESRRGRKGRRKDAILDPVTGVLKPSVISTYMQRMMSDLRYKKQKAALFCIGVNNMEHIARFHGDDVADEVLAGISKILQEHFRSADLIGRHEKYAFLVLATCSVDEAEGIGRRISTYIQQAEFALERKKLRTTITLGVAAYPEHGRNLHQLYLAGQKVLDYSRANDIRAYAVYDPEIHDRVQVKPMRNIKSVKA